MTDSIEKTVELKAPVSRVWKALTDHREFGAWFRVTLDGPFAPGAVATGHITYPGYEHLTWRAVVRKIEPQRLFSFTWHPFAVEPGTDYSQETPTLVEFYRGLWAQGPAGAQIEFDVQREGRIQRQTLRSVDRLDQLNLKRAP